MNMHILSKRMWNRYYNYKTIFRSEIENSNFDNSVSYYILLLKCQHPYQNTRAISPPLLKKIIYRFFRTT